MAPRNHVLDGSSSLTNAALFTFVHPSIAELTIATRLCSAVKRLARFFCVRAEPVEQAATWHKESV